LVSSETAITFARLACKNPNENARRRGMRGAGVGTYLSTPRRVFKKRVYTDPSVMGDKVAGSTERTCGVRPTNRTPTILSPKWSGVALGERSSPTC